MTEPEISTATAALAALPAEWISPEFQASVLRRASLQAVHRKVAAQVAAATAAANAALAALDGDPSDVAIQALVAARQTQASLSEVEYVLPPVTLDFASANQAVTVASAALAQCAPRAPIVLDYEDELVRWRNFTHSSSGARSDAPVATDADRAAQASWTDADARVKQWAKCLVTVRSLDINSSDALGLLASVASYIDRAAIVAQAVESANVTTVAANKSRAEQGLNWSAS